MGAASQRRVWFKVTHTPYSKLAVSLEGSAQQSIPSKRPSKRSQDNGLKNGFFRSPALFRKSTLLETFSKNVPETRWFPERSFDS
jgi:hypothetical protein